MKSHPLDFHDLTQKTNFDLRPDNFMWHPISTAPFNRDLELGVIDAIDVHALVFPCRRILGGWVKAETKKQIDLRPTHWREWPS